MDDEKWEFLLQKWIDKTLTIEEAKVIDAYLKEDPDLEKKMLEMRSLSSILNQMEEVEVPQDFSKRVLTRLEKENKGIRKRNKKKEKTKTGPSRWLVAAAAVLLVFVSATSFFPEMFPVLSRLSSTQEQAKDSEKDGVHITSDPEDSFFQEGGFIEGSRVAAVNLPLEEKGREKLSVFPKKGPFKASIEIIHGEESEAEEQVVVPYYWFYGVSGDLNKAKEAIVDIARHNNGQVEEIVFVSFGEEAPSRLNATIFIPQDAFFESIESFNYIGDKISVLKTNTDVAEEMEAALHMLEEAEDRLNRTRAALKIEQDQEKKQQFFEDLDQVKKNVAFWEDRARQLSRGIVEISIVLEE